MAEILITGMDLSEERQIIITKDGKVLATDWRGISMPTEATARQLPPHGRLIDADALLPKSGYDPMIFKHKYDGDHRTQYDTLMGYEILGIVEDAPTVLEAST